MIELSEEKRNFIDAWKRDEETGEYLFRESFFFKYLILLFCVVTIGYFMCSFFVVRWILGAAIGMMELYRIYKRKAVF